MIAKPPALTLIAIVAACASSAALGWRHGATQGEARRMQCEQAREREARAAAEAAAALLARAQGADAQAARRLAAARAETDKRLEETRREIYSLSTGRECLSGALRLRLNAALAAGDDLSQAAGTAAATAAESAADTSHGSGSTDADVAGCIVDAARAYDECRARIDALRHWDEVTHGR